MTINKSSHKIDNIVIISSAINGTGGGDTHLKYLTSYWKNDGIKIDILSNKKFDKFNLLNNVKYSFISIDKLIKINDISIKKILRPSSYNILATLIKSMIPLGFVTRPIKQRS